jgi:hypothetical protein
LANCFFCSLIGGNAMRKAVVLGIALAGVVMLFSGPAAATLHWGSLSKECSAKACTLHYSAILWDIPWGQDWYSTCMKTPNSQLGGRTPNSCNSIVNEWGNWLVYDPAGAKATGCAC